MYMKVTLNVEHQLTESLNVCAMYEPLVRTPGLWEESASHGLWETSPQTANGHGLNGPTRL